MGHCIYHLRANNDVQPVTSGYLLGYFKMFNNTYNTSKGNPGF